MRVPHFLSKPVLATAALVVAWAPGAQNPFAQQGTLQRPNTPASAAQLEEVEHRLGPFSIRGQDYTVVLRKKRLPGARDRSLAETLAALEIRDAAGSALYQKAFPYEVGQDGFRRSVSASARFMSGNSGAALLISYEEEPAALQSGESWQVIGIVNGKLALFGKPSVPREGMAGPFTMVIMRGNGAAH